MNQKYLLTDSGFWIALLDKQSNVLQHETAVSIIELVERNKFTVLIPWPTLYEFVNTRLARRQKQLFQFEDYLQKPNIQLLDESEYRELSLKKAFQQAKFGFLTHSLVDSVIRGILEDKKVRIDFFATFNQRDFEDVCLKRKVQILN